MDPDPPTFFCSSRYADIISAQGLSEPVFIVQRGALGFSVVVFAVGAMLCLGTLVLRRRLYGAELGGPRRRETFAFFAVLWTGYIVASSWYSFSSE